MTLHVSMPSQKRPLLQRALLAAWLHAPVLGLHVSMVQLTESLQSALVVQPDLALAHVGRLAACLSGGTRIRTVLAAARQATALGAVAKDAVATESVVRSVIEKPVLQLSAVQLTPSLQSAFVVQPDPKHTSVVSLHVCPDVTWIGAVLAAPRCAASLRAVAKGTVATERLFAT